MTPPFQHQIRIYTEDTDLNGMVYHSQFINFMERARTEWLYSHGYDLAQLYSDTGLGLVVHKVNITYTSPARFGSILLVSVTPKELRRTSVTFAQDVVQQHDGVLNCRGEVQVVAVNPKGRPTALPAGFYELCKL